MTATPRFYTSRLRREAGVHDVEVASMDDETVFGPVLHRLTLRRGQSSATCSPTTRSSS